MSDYSPPTFDSPNFNTSLFLTDGGGYLTLLNGDSRYLRLAGGTISGLTTFLAGANVNGTLSINGSPVDLSLISGVTAGTPASNKVLSLDALGNINGPLNCSDINTNTILRVNRTTNGQSFNSTNGTSSCVLYHFNNGDAYLGTSTVNNLVFQTHNTARMTINGSTGAISGISSLSTTSLIVNGISVSSSDLAYLSSITPGTVTASKALVVDGNKDISGLNIINSNGIVLTPTNYTLTSPNIQGCLWRTNSSRLSAFREIDTNNWSWGYSGGGVWNDILVMSNSTYRITVNGDLNYTGSLRSSGTVVLDSSRNLTAADITATNITATTSIASPFANIRDNAQASGTRSEFLSLGRSSSGSDHGAFSFMNYYQSATQGDSNYITFGPRLRTGLTTGWGMVMTQNGNVSFQDKNANGGAGGFKIQSNIVGTVDIQGGVTRTVGAGHGFLQANAGSPADYNASSVSTRIGLWVENAIWCGDKVYASSDSRLKRDIKTIPLDEAKKLLNINAVSYRWQKDIDDSFSEDIGFIAQDLLENKLDKIVSFCPSSDKEKFPLGYSYGLEYQKVCVYQNELIKDLYVQIEELKTITVLNTSIIKKQQIHIENLQSDIEALKKAIETILTYNPLKKHIDKST